MRSCTESGTDEVCKSKRGSMLVHLTTSVLEVMAMKGCEHAVRDLKMHTRKLLTQPRRLLITLVPLTAREPPTNNVIQ